MLLREWLQQIRFLQVGPHMPVAGDWDQAFELENTWLGPPDAELKARLAPLLTIPRMSTLAIGALINQAVAHLPPGQAYVNVGVWHGFSFLAGLYNNPDKHCIGLDNFSQDFALTSARESFLARFEACRSACHQFLEIDYRQFFQTPQQVPPIGFYFYDGHHSYASQLEALTLVEPFLAPGALILIDDINWLEVRTASTDFLLSHPQTYEILCCVETCQHGHPTFWNGLLLAQKRG
jgi:hypothetical protein